MPLMETIIFQIYGGFILTLAGFVLPILVVAMSAFPEGFKALRQTYENEQKQAKKNLEDELKKQTGENGLDYDLLGKNIATLRKTKKRAQRRLSYLSPSNILSKSAIAIGISLVSFLGGLSLYTLPVYVSVALFIVSIGFLIWTLIIFFNSIGIIIEASTTVQQIRRMAEEKTLELLTTLVDNSKKGDTSLFINQEDIHIMFHGERIVSGKEYTFSVNNKHAVKISVTNSSDYMLKTAELGFICPPEILIPGGNISSLSVYTGEKVKIIRFNHDHIQSHEHLLEGAVDMTFLKVGTFSVDAFIKGENLKKKSIKFNIKVVK